MLQGSIHAHTVFLVAGSKYSSSKKNLNPAPSQQKLFFSSSCNQHKHTHTIKKTQKNKKPQSKANQPKTKMKKFFSFVHLSIRKKNDGKGKKTKRVYERSFSWVNEQMNAPTTFRASLAIFFLRLNLSTPHFAPSTFFVYTFCRSFFFVYRC